VESGGQPGNKNAEKGRLWSRAIDKALANRSKTDAFGEMVELAEQLLVKCNDGELAALKEFGDRIDGKPAQSVSLGGIEGAEAIKMEVSFVDTNPPS